MNFNVQPSCKILPCVARSQKLFHLWIYQRILHEIHWLKQYCWRLSSTVGLHRLSWWSAEIPRKVHAGCRWIKMYVILMYLFLQVFTDLYEWQFFKFLLPHDSFSGIPADLYPATTQWWAKEKTWFISKRKLREKCVWVNFRVSRLISLCIIFLAQIPQSWG